MPLRRDKAALRQMLTCALPLTVPQYRRNRLLVQQARPRVGEPISHSVCCFSILLVKSRIMRLILDLTSNLLQCVTIQGMLFVTSSRCA